MPPIPTITRRDGRLFCRTAAGEVEIAPSHADRARARYWRCIAADGRGLTPWVGTPRIAAAWAAAQGR